jgi:non-ribosomal peptide synthetase-like protein
MDNRRIDAQVSDVNEDISEINQLKSIYKDDIYHGEIDFSLIRDECLFEIFENTTDAYPARPAVIFQNKEYSYEKIDSDANRLAWYLRERGIQSGDKVGLILEKSAEMYVAMLGIMKSGAAYVPIDASYPPDRVKYIIENSEVSLTITSSSIACFFGLYNNTLLLDHERDIIDKFSGKRPKRTETGVTPKDLCYIIYTSGSTGRPKGVQIEHKSICNLVRASQDIYQIKPEDRVYQGFTVAFDASLEEIWMAFGHGAALVPQTPEMQMAGSSLGKLLNDAHVTILSCVPTLLSMMTEDIPSLRLIILGGEACPQYLVEKWSKTTRRLVNTYGPTEATVIATYSELKPGKKVTIGRPLSNYSIYIMHEDGSFLPPGEAGELVIGGIGLARGYIGHEDLNKDKFIENPEFKSPNDSKRLYRTGDLEIFMQNEASELLIGGIDPSRGHIGSDDLNKEKSIENPELKNSKDSKRLYRTGDLARFDQNGEIEFLGRIDSQVKIRGFRVELSEIESVINSAKGVRTSVVAVHDSPEGIQKLAAHIVPEDKKEAVDLANVYKLLKERLPSYMIPQYVELIDEIPMLPSGKADRKSLPLPKDSIRAPRSEIEVEPRTELEAKIAEVWKSIFKIDSVSVKDHFFNDLGGHSLFAANTVSVLRKDPKMAFLNFSDLYESPTIEQLAKKVASHKFYPSNTAKASSSPKPDVMAPEMAERNAFKVTAAQSGWLLLELLVGSALAYLGLFWFIPWLLNLPMISNLPLPSSWMGWIGLIVLFIILEPFWLTGIRLIFLPLSVAVAVGAKRIIIGKYKPTRAPVWSNFYFRIWMVRHFMRFVPWGMIAGTEFQCMALRALGARIGKRVHIHRGVNLQQGGWDLLNIGDDVTVSQDAFIGLVELEKGQVVVGPVTLENGATLDIRAGTGPNTRVGAHAWLTALSWLPEGGIVPPDEKWDGVPAQPAGKAPKPPTLTDPGKCLSPTVHGMAMILSQNLLSSALALPYTLALVLLFVHFYPYDLLLTALKHPAESYNSLLWALGHPTVSLSLKLFATAVLFLYLAQISTFALRALAARALGTVSPGIISRWSLAYIRVWLKTGLVSSVDELLCGSRFYPVWLRVAGMKVGSKCEIGAISDVVPELIQINQNVFFADGIYLGGPRIQQGTVTLANVVMGRNTFLGNHVVVPAGQRLPEDILIGVGTVADDRIIKPGTSWFGHPPFDLINHETLTADRNLTFDPPLIRLFNRSFWECLRFTLPLVPILAGISAISGVIYAKEIMPLWALLLFGIPAISLASGASLCLFVLGLKWGLLGRVKEATHPLYSCWISRWDFQVLSWVIIARGLLSLLDGTLLLPVYLRLMGMKIGKRVVSGDGLSMIVDPDMLEVGDDATIKARFQAHTFEDRVLKIGHIRMETDCTLGTNTIPLYGVNIGVNTFVASGSVIMKGETLPAWTSWEGSPTKLMNEVMVPSDSLIEKSLKLIPPLEKIGTSPSFTFWRKERVGQRIIHSEQIQSIDIGARVEEE